MTHDRLAEPWRFLDTGEPDRRLQHGARRVACPRRSPQGTGRPRSGSSAGSPGRSPLGYNQGTGELDAARCAADGIDIVRRPTGGRAILHAEELTYSVVMHAGRTEHPPGVQRHQRGARPRTRASTASRCRSRNPSRTFREEYRSPSSIPCFSSSARYEIEWQGRKLVGSAQRRFAGGERRCGAAARLDPLRAGAPDGWPTIWQSRRGHAARRIRADACRRRPSTSPRSRGRAVDIDALAGCIRRGFEEAWGITFTMSAADARGWTIAHNRHETANEHDSKTTPRRVSSPRKRVMTMKESGREDRDAHRLRFPGREVSRSGRHRHHPCRAIPSGTWSRGTRRRCRSPSTT